MSRKSKLNARIDSGLVEVKSKFDAEFRRFSLNRQNVLGYNDFYQCVELLHCLQSVPFTITYADPEGDLLPINNDENFAVAVATARPLLRLHIQRKGQSVLELSGYGTAQRRKNKLSKFVPSSVLDVRSPHIAISLPEDFRRVSAIIDVDIVPSSQRRVRLMKSGVDAAKPLGFYIRDGTSIRVTPSGVEKVPGIFISRLVPGGIAESTGLLAVNDEVLEVNGIEVAGKTLDQVTDMMVANSSNMIITVKPANQNNNVRRGGPSPPVRAAGNGGSQKSSDSYKSALSGESLNAALIENENDEEDEVIEVTEHVSSMVMTSDAGKTQSLAWATVDAGRSSGSRHGKHKTAETSSLSSDDRSILDEAGIPMGSWGEVSLVKESGDARARESFGSLKSKENAPGPAHLNDSQNNDKLKNMDIGDARNLQKGANNNEVKPSSGVKVLFTPIEDL